MRTHTKLILINMIGVTCTLVAAGSLVALSERYEMHIEDWRARVDEKSQAFEVVRGAVGYGGKIHALKNYVIRREQSYIEQFNESAEQAREGIARYRATEGVSQEELADMGMLEEMLERYEGAMEIALGSDLPAEALDEAIRIDDTPYIEAVQRLMGKIQSDRYAVAAKIDSDLALGMKVGIITGILSVTIVLGLGGFLAVRVGHRLEAGIAAQTREVEQRSQFLANMSHEIRTPLTAVLGFAQLARDKWIAPEEREAHLIRIQRNGVHLMDLINNILDMSKLEAGQVQIASAPVNIRRLIHEVVSIAGVRANERGIPVLVEFEDDLPASLHLDPMRVRQILVNLLGNSTKFTVDGSVTVRAAFSTSEDGSGELHVRVIDTGVGIESHDLGRIFETFTQGDSTATRRFGGTGLGLNISMRLARIMDGDIDVQSEIGRGSEFTFRVPTMVAEFDASEATDTTPELPEQGRGVLDGMRVLLVEDGPDNRVLLEKFLDLGGADVTFAEDGQVAIDTIRDADPFDLVLMDMQMPNVDGYEATRRLRACGYTAPIVALTAHAMSEDRERCTMVGCDGYMSKPIGRKELISTCLQYARARAA